MPQTSDSLPIIRLFLHCRWRRLAWAMLASGGWGVWMGAIAEAADLSRWRFNPDTAQLEIVLTGDTAPRYFVLAQPARIVLDLPNIDVGEWSGEQSFDGAVQSVRVAQFEPDLGRVVLMMSPDAVFAPGQAELTAVETLPSGETRWVLRPLLQGGLQDDAIASPPAPPAEPPTQEPRPTFVPNTLPLDDSEAANAPDTPVQEPTPAENPNPEASPTSQAEAPPEPPMPEPDPVPSDAAEADAEPPNTPTPTNLETILAEQGILPSDAPTVSPGQGADLLQTEPAVRPTAPSLATPSRPTENDPVAAAPPAPSDEFNFPDAEGVDIPIDFPTPDGSQVSEEPEALNDTPSEVTVPPPSAPAPAPQVTVPPPIEAAAVPDPMPMPPIDPPDTPMTVGDPDPAVDLARGAGIRLRYPRTTPLAVPPVQPWQEVLVVDEAVRNSTGAVVIPAGSEVIGRFEADGGEMRFITQAIAISGQITRIHAQSLPITPDSGVLLRPNQIIDVQLLQAWQPTL